MILRKIVKIVATRCHILRLKCTKFDFGLGSAGGAYSATPDPLAGLRVLLLRGGRGEEGKEGEEREGKGREGNGGKGREG